MSKGFKLSSSFKNRHFTDHISFEKKRQTLSDLLNTSHKTEAEIEKSQEELRYFIFENSLNSFTQKYRQNIWKLLLEVYYISATCYIDLIQNGVSTYHSDIEYDATQIFLNENNDSDPTASQNLQRVLDSFVWLHAEKPRLTSTETVFISKLLLRHQPIHWKFAYTSTMGYLAMPFMKVMPELDAFFSFTTFIRHCCPLYVQANLIGAHCGVKLLDVCMKIIDPELSGYLRGKGLSVESYAFTDIATFSACVPPIAEALHLWDMMVAFGFHLNVLFVLAQLVRRRAKILSSTSPLKVIRSPPPLHALADIGIALQLLDLLPHEIYLQLVRHPYDETIAYELGVEVSESEPEYGDEEDTDSAT